MGINLNFVGLHLGGNQRDWVQEAVSSDINAVADALCTLRPVIHAVKDAEDARCTILNLIEQQPQGFTLIVANKDVIAEAACLKLIIDRSIPVIVLPKSFSEGDPLQEVVQWALQDHRLLYDTLNALDAEYQRERKRLAAKALKEKQDREQKAFLDHAIPHVLEAMEEQGLNYTAIARSLNDRGVHPQRGGRWYASSVSRLIDRSSTLKDREAAIRTRIEKTP